jgi:hypothetical protein
MPGTDYDFNVPMLDNLIDGSELEPAAKDEDNFNDMGGLDPNTIIDHGTIKIECGWPIWTPRVVELTQDKWTVKSFILAVRDQYRRLCDESDPPINGHGFGLGGFQKRDDGVYELYMET